MSRRFDTSITLDASPDTVWRALVEADTLTQWFATDAMIEPHPGGRYDISWHGDWPWKMTVLESIPGRRLRLRDPKAMPFDSAGQPLAQAEPVELVLEFHLEPAGAGTVLRLVHSGFGHGSQWDDELDGVSDGWQTELRILQHYLGHHAGRPRRIVWARGASSRPIDDVWARLTVAGGLFDEGVLEHARPGTPVSLHIGPDVTVTGEVIFALPKRHALVRADNFGNGLMNVMVHRAGGAAGMQAVLSTWTEVTPEPGLFSRRAQERIDALGAVQVSG
ncbi:MAG TPA: SRPBCC domain-containing protein [Vicinamibacterales bacterium]|nr:SRPBCC domain-containing protein [Vicinamibacterales bacterium]